MGGKQKKKGSTSSRNHKRKKETVHSILGSTSKISGKTSQRKIRAMTKRDDRAIVAELLGGSSFGKKRNAKVYVKQDGVGDWEAQKEIAKRNINNRVVQGFAAPTLNLEMNAPQQQNEAVAVQHGRLAHDLMHALEEAHVDRIKEQRLAKIRAYEAKFQSDRVLGKNVFDVLQDDDEEASQNAKKCAYFAPSTLFLNHDKAAPVFASQKKETQEKKMVGTVLEEKTSFAPATFLSP